MVIPTGFETERQGMQVERHCSCDTAFIVLQKHVHVVFQTEDLVVTTYYATAAVAEISGGLVNYISNRGVYYI